MLHLAIIIIVSCALSAPSEGIAVIGRKSYESADFCLSDERTPKAREVSSIYNVDYEEFSDCVKHKITHRPSFFYNFFINQYQSKNNNYCSIMDSVLKRKKENSGSSEEFAYRKRNLLWTLEGLQSLKTSDSQTPPLATNKPQTKTTTTRRPFLLPCYVLNNNEREKFLALKKTRPPKRKRVRRHTRRTHSVTKPDHFNVKISSRVPADELSRVVWKGGFVEKLRHNQGSPRFWNSENFIDSERNRNIGVKNALRKEEEEVHFCGDDVPYSKRNSLGYDASKKNVRAMGVKNYVGQSLPNSYFVEMNGRRYPHLNHRFIHRSNRKKRRRCNINIRKTPSKSFPLVNHYRPQLRQTMYDTQIKENDELNSENFSNERENIEEPVGFSNSIEHDFSSDLDTPELYPDTKAVKLDKPSWEKRFNTKHEMEEYLRKRNKIIANDYLSLDNQQLRTGVGSKDFAAPETTLQKPYLSDAKLKKKIPFLNYDFPDYDEIYASPDFHKKYRSSLRQKHNNQLWRNSSPSQSKIHKGLRRHLDHMLPMDLKRSLFFKKMDREKKCCCSKNSKCRSPSHKSWKSAPLLCLPYIRKGQDELLKNLIALMQKMVGKADAQKFQLFESTKCKPNVKKVSNEDIMSGAEFDEEDRSSTTESSSYTLSPCDPCQHFGASQPDHKTDIKTTQKPQTPYSFSLPNLNQIYSEGTPNCTAEKCYSTLPPFLVPEGSQNATAAVKTTTVCIPGATPKPPSNTKYTSETPNGESNNATGGTPQKKYPLEAGKTAKERQSNAVGDSYQCHSDQRSNEKFFPEYMDNQENLDILNHSDSEGSLFPSSSNEPFLLDLPDFDSEEKNSDFSIHNISEGNDKSYEPFSKKDLDNDLDYNSNLNNLKHLTGASRNKVKGSFYRMNLKDRHRKNKHHFHRPMMRLWSPEEDDFYGATSTETPEEEEEDESQIDRQFHWKRRREESASHNKRRSSKRYKREDDYNADDFINYDEYLYDSDKNDEDYEKPSASKLEKNEIDSDVNSLNGDYDWTPLNIEFFTDLATAVTNFQQDSSNTESRDKVLYSTEVSISKTGATPPASLTGTSKPLSILEKINAGEVLIASNEPSSEKSSNTTKNANLNKALVPPIQSGSVAALNSSQDSNVVKPISPLVLQTLMKPTNSVNTFASGNGSTSMKVPNLVDILASINKAYAMNGTNFYKDLNLMKESNVMTVIMTSTESTSLKAPTAVKASAATNDKTSVKRIASFNEGASSKTSDSPKESTSISDSTASTEPISMKTSISSTSISSTKESTSTKSTTTATESTSKKAPAESNDKKEASNEGDAPNSSKELTSTTVTTTFTKSSSIKASATSTEQMSVKTSTSAGEQNTGKESGYAHTKEEGTSDTDTTESKSSAKDGIHSITQTSSTEKLERLTNAREENSVDGSSDLDEIEDSQIATTVGTAYIVKGPKKQVIKPSPKMYKKVYPDSLLYDNQKYDTTPITIETATTANHNGLQKVTPTTGSTPPDVRLQLLAVCEGYLEVVKQMKAQNQSLGEELDSDLSKYCESIISQSFSGKVDSTKLNKLDTISLREGKKDIPNLSKKVGNSLEALKTNNTNFVGSVSKVEKKEKPEGGESYNSMSVELGENNETKQSQNGNKINKRKKALNSVKVQEGDDGFMTKGMTQEQLELLRLLKKRKSALLNWMFNSKEGQSQPEYDETEQFDGDDEDKSEVLNFELNSGTARPRGAIISRKTTKATQGYTNLSVYPVYAKQYGYDKGGELRQVEVIWRIGNNQSYEKKPLKNQSILAFFWISTPSPKIKEKNKYVDRNVYSKINKIESQNNNKNFGYTTEVATKVHNSSVAENTTKTTKATKAVSNIPNIIIYVNETNSSSVIGTVSNSTNKTVKVQVSNSTKAPKGIKKTLNKLGKVNTAKEVVEEYTIEFWNYAVYILPIMFSILFLFCCACCAMSILRKRERSRKKKKKKKKFTSSEESLSTEDTDSEPKKKRREKTKNLKNVWNALKKKNRDKVDSDIMDESNPPEKKRNFLRFLKSVKNDKTEETSSVPYSALPESDEADTQTEIKKTSHSEVHKRNHEEQKSEQNEAAERRELIVLLEELKKIELEQMGEKKEQKSVHVQYMIQDEDESAFRRLGQTNVFGLPKGYSFYSKSLPFHDPEEYGIYKDPGELDKLLPCECGYYGQKHDYFRHCDFPEEGRCDKFFKIFPNAGMCRHKLTKVKKFPDKDRNFTDKYGSADTQDGRKSRNEASSREKVRDSTAFNLPRRNPNDWVGDMEHFNRLVTKKKPVRLKDDGVLCRL